IHYSITPSLHCSVASLLHPSISISSLSDWPRSQDEDIYQFPRALLPVSTGSHAGDADKRPKQVDRIKVFPDFAAFDGAFDQTANSFPNLAVRSFVELMGIVDQRIERGRDDLLIGDIVDEQHHPCS